MGNPHALACVRGVLVVSRGSDQDKILKLNKKAINFFFFLCAISIFSASKIAKIAKWNCRYGKALRIIGDFGPEKSGIEAESTPVLDL
jgi:hypothetical protein